MFQLSGNVSKCHLTTSACFRRSAVASSYAEAATVDGLEGRGESRRPVPPELSGIPFNIRSVCHALGAVDEPRCPSPPPERLGSDVAPSRPASRRRRRPGSCVRSRRTADGWSRRSDTPSRRCRVPGQSSLMSTADRFGTVGKNRNVTCPKPNRSTAGLGAWSVAPVKSAHSSQSKTPAKFARKV